jgi:hypothetical protein
VEHDRFPLPGQHEAIEPPQFRPDPNDPEQAAMAAFYARDTQPEPEQELPEPVMAVPRPAETGQFTGPMPARPAERPQYEMPDQIAAYHRDFAAAQQRAAEQQVQQAAREHQGDYFLAPPKQEAQVAAGQIHEGRFGFRALRGAIRRMRTR